jgi:transposase
MAARKTRPDQSEEQARRGHPLRPVALGGLTRFIDDGRIEIDNNTVERSIRPIALNRKNALFAGSDGGAKHWATIASLIETCKLNGIDPLRYLTDVLIRIVNGHPNSQIDDLLPWAYRVTQATRAVA